MKNDPTESTAIQLRDFRRQQTVESENDDPLSIGSEVSLAWRNLRCEVPERLLFSKKRKVILKRLTGHVKRRTLNGFMGPSGAGKTTLLSCLNGNIRNLAQGTELYVNKDEPKFPKIAFIEQHVHETIVGGLTVQEVLYYAFRFKNVFHDRRQLDLHIKTTLKELLLDPKILERRFNQCSGGEQKRVAIAQELMSLKKPSFLFIDEPTTGLDSQAALLMIQCLRNLTSAYSITVMVTIHMPNDEITRMFDQFYILAKGGICIYAGSRENLRNNLRQILNIEINSGQPPIEEYLKIACNGIEDKNVLQLAEHTLMEQNEKLRPYKNQLRYLATGMPRKYKKFSFGDLFLQLARLCYIIMIVEYRLILYQSLCYTGFYMFMTTVFNRNIVMISTCYSMINPNETCSQLMHEDSDAHSYVNYQACSVLFFNILKITLGATLFIPLLKVFRNEHRNHWYSMMTFYWSFVLIRFIEMSFYALLITVMIYFPMGHHHIDGSMNWLRFGNFTFFIWLSCLYFQSIGQLISLLFLEKMEISLISAQVLFVILSLVNGYLVNLSRLNPLLQVTADYIGTKYLTNGLIYTFYVFDRCDLETHISKKLTYFDINTNTIYSDLKQIAINILIIRIITIIMMYIHFSLNSKVKKLKQSSKAQDWEMIPIDADNIKKSNSITNIINLNEIDREKDDKELEFEEFSRHKIIVGWRMLTLFGSSSILEIRSVQNIHENSKIILRNLNGQFRFGTLNALMGTSGAGKTSFLKVLNGRLKTYLSDETRIYMSKYTPIRVCYLMQEVSGHLWPGLTVKQSLIYASKLKNCSEKGKVDHEKIALKILDELDISDAANTLSQNCSGGQKKRLALALELTALRMPNLICIDEPISGLDSNSAEIVIRCLRRLVHRHSITIVASIHQVGTEMLMLFDYCYVLAKGGVCIYADIPNNIPQHLNNVPEIGWSPETDSFPVEELIKCSCENYKNPIIEKLTELTKEKILMSDIDLYEETQNVIDGIQMNRTRFSLISIWFLCCRHWFYVRNYLWIYLVSFYSLYLLYGLVVRSFFNQKMIFTSGCISLEEDFNLCNHTQEQLDREIDLSSNARYSLFINCFLMCIIMLQAALFFAKESVYLFNEHRNGWYSTGAYLTMKSLYDIVPLVVIMFIYVYIIDIYEVILPRIFWWILLLMVISFMTFQSIGYLVALLVINEQNNSGWEVTLITVYNITIFFLMTMLSNFHNPIKEMHYVYQMISNLSIIRWVNEANILLQYGFGRCGRKEIQALLYFMMIYHDEYFYECIRMLFFNLLLFRILTFLVLLFKVNPLENRRERAQRILTYHEQLQPSRTIIPGLSSHAEFTIKQIQINSNTKKPIELSNNDSRQLVANSINNII